jgi:hypothetical protein
MQGRVALIWVVNHLRGWLEEDVMKMCLGVLLARLLRRSLPVRNGIALASLATGLTLPCRVPFLLPRYLEHWIPYRVMCTTETCVSFVV